MWLSLVTKGERYHRGNGFKAACHCFSPTQVDSQQRRLQGDSSITGAFRGLISIHLGTRFAVPPELRSREPPKWRVYNFG